MPRENAFFFWRSWSSHGAVTKRFTKRRDNAFERKCGVRERRGESFYETYSSLINQGGPIMATLTRNETLLPAMKLCGKTISVGPYTCTKWSCSRWEVVAPRRLNATEL